MDWGHIWELQNTFFLYWLTTDKINLATLRKNTSWLSLHSDGIPQVYCSVSFKKEKNKTKHNEGLELSKGCWTE